MSYGQYQRFCKIIILDVGKSNDINCKNSDTIFLFNNHLVWDR